MKMAGSDEKEKGENEEADVKTKSTESPTKKTAKNIDNNEATDTLMKENKDTTNLDENKLQIIKDNQKEIQLVKHLMKLKSNPSIKHLTKFVKRLEKIVATINNLEGVKMMYQVSDELSEKVQNNLKELEFLSIEMKATLNDLQRLKEKKIIIGKEKEALNEKRSNTKREEMQEMETIIGVYDKDLLRSWHLAKKSTSVQTVENFITHLKGKKQATEYAFKMASEKLATLKNRLTKQLKTVKPSVIKALPPPSSDSDQDSVISTD
ncbi:hypothetical protein O3M35_003676 [Rhynocoris fuscipes]|uniref:Uncharacterized protein n=1 Tax=Rhynocoris fuscipes TaxID=488301 RepID=A0AAW1CJN9_9HEMI